MEVHNHTRYFYCTDLICRTEHSQPFIYLQEWLELLPIHCHRLILPLFFFLTFDSILLFVIEPICCLLERLFVHSLRHFGLTTEFYVVYKQTCATFKHIFEEIWQLVLNGVLEEGQSVANIQFLGFARMLMVNAFGIFFVWICSKRLLFLFA